MEALLSLLEKAPALLVAALSPGARIPAAPALAGALLLALLTFAGARLAPRDRPVEARLAGFAWLSTALALLAAPLLDGSGAHVAPFLWLSLAFSAASLAGRYLGSSFQNKRVVSALLVLMLGGYLHARAGAANRKEARLTERPPAFASPSGPEDERKEAEACLAKEPGSCPCMERRAGASLALFEPERALGEAREARNRCAHRPEPHALEALALLALGDEEAAKEAIARAPRSGPGEARLGLVALALGLPGEENPVLSAAREAGLAREADLVEARLALRAGDPVRARMLAEALMTADRRDPEPHLVLAELAELAEASGRGGPENLRRADEALRNALALAPRHASALAGRARLAHAAGRCAAAAKLVADLERAHPTHREIQRLRAKLEAERWNALSPCR